MNLSVSKQIRRLSDSNLIAIVIADLHGRILEANDAFGEISGYSREDLAAGKVDCGRMAPPGWADLDQQARRKLLSSESVEPWEREYTRKDGSRVMIQVTAAMLEGSSDQCIAYVQPVSDRNTAESAEEESDRYKILAETASDGIIMIDESGVVQYANPAVTEIFGYTVEELVGSPIQTLMPEPERGIHEKFFSEYLQTGKKHVSWRHSDRVGISKKGGRVPVEISLAESMQQGKRLFTGIIRQATAHNRNHARKLQAELIEELILESGGEGIYGVFVSTPEGRLLSCNHVFARIFGFASVEEALGTDLSSLYPTPESRENYLVLLNREGRLNRFETELRRCDGKHVHVIENSIGVYDHERRLVEIKGYITDNTERKLLERHVVHSQKMEAVSQLASGVAHDFNNVLMAIGGYSELLISQIPEDHPFRWTVLEILKSISSGGDLTRQLLAFSRKQVLSPKILDLNQTLVKMQNISQRFIGEGVELATNLAEDLGYMYADPSRIEQVVMNLIINARDAMLQGGRLVIETSNVELDEHYTRHHPPVEPGTYIQMCISDTGTGMDEETLSHIFEPFYTTKPEGKGSGLGLSTVYGIVKQSGGHISVYSQKNRGTTFKVYFPRVDKSDFLDELYPEATENLQGHGETILLVDDNKPVRESLAACLDLKGYVVLSAENGPSAIKIVGGKKDEIKLLISDVIMPGMSGIELAAKLRETLPNLKVLFMSGYAEDAIKTLGILEAGSEFLSKPAPVQTLLSRIRRLLEQ